MQAATAQSHGDPGETDPQHVSGCSSGTRGNERVVTSIQEMREVSRMKKLMATMFWLGTVAMALFPVIAEARLATNHNETLVRDDG